MRSKGGLAVSVVVLGAAIVIALPDGTSAQQGAKEEAPPPDGAGGEMLAPDGGAAEEVEEDSDAATVRVRWRGLEPLVGLDAGDDLAPVLTKRIGASPAHLVGLELAARPAGGGEPYFTRSGSCFVGADPSGGDRHTAELSIGMRRAASEPGALDEAVRACLVLEDVPMGSIVRYSGHSGEEVVFEVRFVLDARGQAALDLARRAHPERSLEPLLRVWGDSFGGGSTRDERSYRSAASVVP